MIISESSSEKKRKIIFFQTLLVERMKKKTVNLCVFITYSWAVCVCELGLEFFFVSLNQFNAKENITMVGVWQQKEKRSSSKIVAQTKRKCDMKNVLSWSLNGEQH